MRKIEKMAECDELREWKRKNPKSHYKDLDDSTRRAIRQSLLDEQYGLCAYCCQQLHDIDACHNEHLLEQNNYPKRTLDHDNLVASCNTTKQCGHAHGSQSLPLTPLMPECETELRFKWSGRVEGTTERAEKAIQVLRLGGSNNDNRALIEKRKQLCETLIIDKYSADRSDLHLEGADFIQLVIEEICKPQEGKLEPFAPVLVNILRELVENNAGATRTSKQPL